MLDSRRGTTRKNGTAAVATAVSVTKALIGWRYRLTIILLVIVIWRWNNNNEVNHQYDDIAQQTSTNVLQSSQTSYGSLQNTGSIFPDETHTMDRLSGPEHHHQAASGVASKMLSKDESSLKEELLRKCQHYQVSVNPTRNGTADHATIWVPGFPGSGSELFRKIVVAMTGLPAGDIYESSSKRCNLYPATCKTHCPFLQPKVCPVDFRLKVGCKKACEQPLSYRENYFDRQVWLLVRNPKNAIPSYENWAFEGRRNLTTHSQQMPQGLWKQRRNQNFGASLSGWVNMINWWTRGSKNEDEETLPRPHTGHSYNVSLIIPYEQLTSPIHGPRMLQQVAEELRKSNISSIFHDGAMFQRNGESNAGDEVIDPWSCLWTHLVLSKNSTTKRSSSDRYIPSYRRSHQEKFVAALDGLLERFSASSRSDIIPILKSYRADIEANLRLENNATESES